MKLIKYFLNKQIFWIYPCCAAVISLVVCLIVRDFSDFIKLFIPLVCILFALRTQDDIADFEKDEKTKKQHLSKKHLTVLCTLFWMLFVLSNIISYSTIGIYSVFFIVYALLWEKVALLKILFAPILFICFLAATDNLSLTTVSIGTIVFIALSLTYYIIKKGIKK